MIEIAVVSRTARSWPKFEHNIDDKPFGYAPLSMVLPFEFRWDAHIVAYSVPSIPRRLGMNEKRAGTGRTIWECMPTSGIPMVLHIVDVDAPDGIRADPQTFEAWRAAEHAKVACVFIDMPGYCYATRGGYRIMWLIEPFVVHTPHDHAVWSATYKARLDLLRDRYGIIGDRACADWTRLYRLPRVLRDPNERTAAAPYFCEIGDSQSIGIWTAPVYVPPVQAPKTFDANVPEPTWNAEIDIAAARKHLAAYLRKQRDRVSLDPKAARRADIVDRILTRRALVDDKNLGVSGLGRDNTVYEAANLLAWVCPELGPTGADHLLFMSIALMDCDGHGGKGRAAYLEKAREVYVDSVKKLRQTRAQQLLERAASLRGGAR